MYVNAIGAVDYNGEQSWYSEGCSNLIAVAPSSGLFGKGITTGDLMGSAGYDPTECTDSFGGTSSAAPLATGIIALLLEKNPNLTWRDVKHVIAKGSTQINPQDASWHTNARGYHHSNKYGFGLLKVPLLLSTLKNYTLLSEKEKQKQALSSIVHPRREDANSFIINMTKTNMSFLEIAIVRIALTHPSRGDLEIRLISPEGTVNILADRRSGDRYADYPPSDGWTFSSLHFWGESSVDGLWEIQVDSGSSQKARVQWLMIGLFGF
jgi:subtilisin-like proprotein convertase family protein